MSNTKRPTTARKVTPRTEANREAALGQGLRLTVDGVNHDVRLGDISSSLAKEVRANTGYGPLQLINAVFVTPDIDLVSAFVWLARRIKGERVAFDAVQVTYAQMLSDGFEMDLPDADEEPDPQT